jgi:hypothetical protein
METKIIKHKKLMTQLQELGVMLTGRLRTVYKSCGKENCKCVSKNKDDLHGPYLYWDRLVNGKLSGSSINPKKKKFYQKAIQNRKDFDKIRASLLKLGEKIADIT